MKSFKIYSPASIDEALKLLPHSRGPAAFNAARLVAGGQDLLGEMKDHLVEPEALVNLTGIPGLDTIHCGSSLTLGALVRLVSLERHGELRAGWTAIAEAAESVASPQIRSQATLGGNLCQRPRCWYYRNEHAPCIKKGGHECFAEAGQNKYNAIFGGGPSYIVHPSDLAPALVCLDATVTIAGGRGRRDMLLEDFFTLPNEGSVERENVLKADEAVVGVSVPRLPSPWRSCYLKFRERGSFDFALASVAVALAVEGGAVEGGEIKAAKIVLGGVAPIPWRCTKAENYLVGKPHEPATWRRAEELAVEGAEPLEHNGYKVRLANGLCQKALRHLA